MSLKKNTIANYCGRIYSILIGIIILPFYLRYLGSAAFGLISLYTVMQAWLTVLDMGLTPALSREVAYCHNRDNGYFEIRQLLRSLEIIFFVINIAIVLGIFFSSHWMAHHWLKVENLAYSEVSYCIAIIGLMISLRWFADLYRAGILGIEQQVWLNGVGIIITTLQYVGGYVLLRWVTRTPSHFFEYQLLVAAIELFILGIKLYKIFPISSNHFLNFNISWSSVRKVLPFASGIFYSALVWTLLTQLDKLVLSHILSLSTFGYFALVTVASGGILQFVAPISQAILPRMTSLLSQGNKPEMLQLYRNATQIIAVIMLPLAGITAFYGTEVMYIWTGNRLAANWAGPILFWYALGNGILSISAFQYYLQFAHGNLKLHVIFNTVFAMLAIPLILFSAYHYGALGTAIAWFLIQFISFFIWPPIIHRKYAPGIHYEWLAKDILPTLIAVVTMLACIRMIPINFGLMSRCESFTILVGLTMFILIGSVITSSTCRHLLATLICGQRKITA